MKEQWAAELDVRARAHWTPDQLRTQLGDKRLLLPPVEAAPLLRMLGLLKTDATMMPSSVRKYLQINHMVILLEAIMLDLIARHRQVRIIDAGCGGSYLTLLLAWCFANRWRHPAQIVGIDRNPALVEKCRVVAETVGLDHFVRFETASIGEVDVAELWQRCFGAASNPDGFGIHGLVALHACDTATDEAIAQGIALGAEFIGVVPCCEGELARAWSELDAAGAPGVFAPIWRAAHLRRATAATMTDALRTLLLRSSGYLVTPIEFVPSVHTPKNTLLRATRGEVDVEAVAAEYRALKATIGGTAIRLEALLPSEVRERVCAARTD